MNAIVTPLTSYTTCKIIPRLPGQSFLFRTLGVVGQFPRSTNVTSSTSRLNSQLSTVHLPDSFSDSLALTFINILISFYGKIVSIITRALIRPTSTTVRFSNSGSLFETDDLRSTSLRRAQYLKHIISFNSRIFSLHLLYLPIIIMLCEPCQEIFQGNWSMRASFAPHHWTTESLLRAVRHGCYICTKVWGNLELRPPPAWEKDTWNRRKGRESHLQYATFTAGNHSSLW
jgi:hypothetical protein